MRLSRIALLLAAVLFVGCAESPQDPGPSGEVGQIQIPLTTTDPSGTTYVLSNATFQAAGPVAQTISGDGEWTVYTELPFGTYQVTLQPGWALSRREADGALTPLDAILVSKNPVTARVQPDSVAFVWYEFLLASEDGQLGIGFGVYDRAAALTGHLRVTSDASYGVDGIGVPNGFTGMLGESFDFVVRFASSGSYTGTVDGTVGGARFRDYFTSRSKVTFPGSEAVLGQLGERLTGNYPSLYLREVPALDPTQPPSHTVQVVLSDNSDDGVLTYFIIQPSSLWATNDETGFPFIASGGNFLHAQQVTIERYQRQPSGGFSLVGQLAAEGEIFLDMP